MLNRCVIVCETALMRTRTQYAVESRTGQEPKTTPTKKGRNACGLVAGEAGGVCQARNEERNDRDVRRARNAPQRAVGVSGEEGTRARDREKKKRNERCRKGGMRECACQNDAGLVGVRCEKLKWIQTGNRSAAAPAAEVPVE